MAKSNLLSTVLFCAIVLTAPLQWQRLANFGGLSVASFHIVSLLFIFTIFLNLNILRSIKISELYIIFIAFLLYLSLLAIASIFESGHYGFRDFVRQFFYIATSISIAIYLSAIGFKFRNPNKVLWALSLVPVLLVYLMWVAISETKDPAILLISAISQKDPDLLIHHVFKAAISSGEENLNAVQANLRHQIVGGVLAGIFFNVVVYRANRTLIKRVSKLVFIASISLSILIILASMSRSIILSGLLAFVVLFILSLKLNFNLLFYSIATVVAGFVILVGPLGEVLYARLLGNTTSYDVRIGYSSSAFESIESNMFFGTLIEAGSPHNLIIDFWMGFGLLGLFSAIFLIGSIIFKSYIVGIMGYRSNNFIMKMAFIAVCLPFVRWMTASKGQLSFPEWICVGLVLGCIMFSQSRYKSFKLR